MTYFPQAYAIIVSPKIEGGFTKDPMDRGNWTSGHVGVGECKGSNHGISAAAYPTLDIEHLTLPEIEALYLRDYWNALSCDALPWDRALCTFDCGVNQGVHTAKSIAASMHSAEDFMAERALYYAHDTQDAALARDGRGWMRRLFNIHKLAQTVPT